jgi:hypothetical protein
MLLDVQDSRDKQAFARAAVPGIQSDDVNVRSVPGAGYARRLFDNVESASAAGVAISPGKESSPINGADEIRMEAQRQGRC